MRHSSRYNAQKESEIRFNILSALQELATFNGIDIHTMQTTSPYSMELGGVTSQKIAAEIKKLVDYGMVVKGVVRGKTVKYMLKSTYTDLMKDGKIDSKKFGYGDYRDNKPEEEEEETSSETICARIGASSGRNRYTEMW